MENGQNSNETGAKGSVFVEWSRSRNDILTRLKNRERQRRYRARKRLAADRESTSVRNGATLPQALMEFNKNCSVYVSRIHCERKWKKDARRAHMSQKIEESHDNTVVNPVACSSTENPKLISAAPGLVSETSTGSKYHLDDCLNMHRNDTQRATLCRRDWKAEARSKKN